MDKDIRNAKNVNLNINDHTELHRVDSNNKF